ncbi:GFA family protein [Altererythrobacter sp. TH136]|uniref:GFA family protein n=1 Tax=Altererythrobacter sp. TH136 TaxID=2067415 RepID=UPI00116501EA|nr:GFA family protein [Altererythrobacter sp. TH136]QDM40679.1 GFA family protein [Altererythrobacter sp. TH136]
MASGGCHCGAVRYTVDGEMHHNAVCHCSDCRRSSGAIMVPWAAFAKDALTVESGTPSVYRSSEYGERHFCGRCGTGLFYYNEQMLPGIVDIQAVSFDDAAERAPQAHIQVADSLPWEESLGTLPRFDRYPGA